MQDDWKVNDKLTLNLGLRYEFIATPYEEQNGFIWPDFSAPGGALYIANAKTAAAIRRRESSSAHRPNSTFLLRAENAAPDLLRRIILRRVSASPIGLFGDDKTVLRGGFGKYYDTIEEDELGQSNVNPYPSSSGFSDGPDAALSYPPFATPIACPLVPDR